MSKNSVTCQTMEFKTHAPFGIRTKRFHNVGFHPGLDTTGIAIRKPYNLAPGEYDVKPYECGYKKYLVSGSCWKRKADMEEYSRTLGFRNTTLLEQRRYRESLAGPGAYNVPEGGPQRSSCFKDVGFGKEKRFRAVTKSDYPPPGTYAKGIKKLIDHHRHKQVTPVPAFEWDGFVDRFKSAEPPWKKPPTWYSPVDTTSISATLRKLVSKRGPYDLFTGPRDDTNIKNHFGKSTFSGPLTYFFLWPNDFELLLRHPRNKNKGKFFKSSRFGTKEDSDTPGPASYDVDKKRGIEEAMYSFGTSAKHARPKTDWTIRPGVGRYNLDTPVHAKTSRASWVFKTKIGRPDVAGSRYNNF
ncbi:hypothetical protein FQR65_LT00235 [Abscondita terminalis]|nr:hypothetical protein FQR65_LT00235 [Abscondita terminalis]